jgi:hypothetical protein
MKVNVVTVNKMPFVKMIADNMLVNEKVVYKMSVEAITVDKMP